MVAPSPVAGVQQRAQVLGAVVTATAAEDGIDLVEQQRRHGPSR